MSRYHGIVGYLETYTDSHGVSRESIVERNYYGNVLNETSRWQSGDQANDDLDISNRISIIADPYAYQHFSSIKYLVYMDTKWKVKSVSVEYPRLTLSIGGVYNG